MDIVDNFGNSIKAHQNSRQFSTSARYNGYLSEVWCLFYQNTNAKVSSAYNSGSGYFLLRDIGSKFCDTVGLNTCQNLDLRALPFFHYDDDCMKFYL